MENIYIRTCKSFANHSQIIRKIFGFTSLLFIAFGYGYSQPSLDKAKAEWDKKSAEQLARYELRDFKNSILLNRSFFTEEEVEYYRHLPRNAHKQIEVLTSADEWESLYERLSMADLREKGQRMPDYGSFAEKDRKKLTRSNTTPIGILNLDDNPQSVPLHCSHVKMRTQAFTFECCEYSKMNDF